MRRGWALLLLMACHDPENEALRARVAEQQREIAKLRKEQAEIPPADDTRLRDQKRDFDAQIGALEGENDILRKKLSLYLDMAVAKPATLKGSTTMIPQGEYCWVLFERACDPSKDWPLNRRQTLACYQVAGNTLRLHSAREIGADLEIFELENKRPSVTDVLKGLKKK